jgi:ABC-type molybdate transport system substrate-binding protein
MGLAGLCLAGCGAPEQAQWPKVYVLASQEAAPILTPEAIQYYAEHDGTVIVPQLAPEDQLVAQLEAGRRADVVLTLSARTYEQLAAKKLIAPPPWRFKLQRDNLAVFTREDSTLRLERLDDLRGEAFGPIAIEDTQLPAWGGVVKAGLGQYGLWEPLESRMLRAATRTGVRRAVASGRAPLGIVPRHVLGSWGGSWRLLLEFDAQPGEPRFYYGCVVASTPRAMAARRLWNHLERQIRSPSFLIIPAKK